ncbi:STAS domain-containing protein [Kitasatospora sp. NBC_00240]|uniref:STAS domain-containing protein n=1 Tax=Kitasatospora sp. NBC_00240 TaxID=2903567 RepID=UPI002253D967|nr:STAS domain-containing protein [Kitasatospora sp. NBC_00240]MCX5214988.1 STAS domain-containing protein [Kitasatospora sp. NBC_00240]
MAERPSTAPGDLTVQVSAGASVAYIELSGELDMDTVPQVEETVRQSLLARTRIVIFDVRGLSFCDCAGLGGLLRARQRIVGAHAVFHLENPPPMLVRLAALSGTGGALGLPATPPAVPADPARTDRARVGADH